MKIGISTACLYPLETEKALQLLLDGGFDYFEIFLNTISEIEPAYIEQVHRMLTGNRAAVKSIHPFTSGYEPYLIFTEYTRRFKDSLDFYEQYFEAGQRLGAKLLVIHGDRKTPLTGISDEEYFIKFAELSERGDKYGITVAQENVNLFRSQRADFLASMREYLGGRAKFVLDVKQAVRSGNDPLKVCKAMGTGLVHVHINDNTPERDCLLPGSGSMDYKPLIDILSENHYQGDLMIEVYSNNYKNVEELKIARDYLKQVFSDLNCE